jgi:hypothetical protein
MCSTSYSLGGEVDFSLMQKRGFALMNLSTGNSVFLVFSAVVKFEIKKRKFSGIFLFKWKQSIVIVQKMSKTTTSHGAPIFISDLFVTYLHLLETWNDDVNNSFSFSNEMTNSFLD